MTTDVEWASIKSEFPGTTVDLPWLNCVFEVAVETTFGVSTYSSEVKRLLTSSTIQQ